MRASVCVHEVRLDIRVITEWVGPQDLMSISLLQVTPSERSQQDAKVRELEASFSADGAWTAGSEFAQTPDEGLSKLEDFNRIGSCKSLSKSKRVKSFIQKKCKDFSNSFSGSSHGEGSSESTATVLPRSKSTSRANSEVSTTSWYVANDYHSDEEVLNHVTVVKVGVEVRDSPNVTTVTVAEPELVKATEPDSAKTDCDNIDSRNEGGTKTDPGRKLSDSDSDEDPFFLAQEVPHDDSDNKTVEDVLDEYVSQYETGSEEKSVDEAPVIPVTEVSFILNIIY